MRSLALACCLGAFSVLAQDRSELWLSAGIKREVVKDLVASYQTNARIRTDGRVQTLFQEVGIKSEHLGWLRPSVDYRFIASYAPNGNTVYSNRFNMNLDFRQKAGDNFKYGLRLRYQLSLGSGLAVGASDLDPALRFKPYVAYSIPKSRFTPGLSAEWFYNPVNEPTDGHRFNRVRFGASVNIDLPKSHEVEITYYYGRRFNTGNPHNEYLLSLEYGYEWKKAKNKKKKNKGPGARSVRDL